MTPAQVRGEMVTALGLDLVGPEPGSSRYQDEVLPQAPSRWYLTGFLVPYEAKAEDRRDAEGAEQLDLGLAQNGDDEPAPEAASARRAFLPSSIGISVLVPAEAQKLQVTISWGDYSYLEAEKTESDEPGNTPVRWQRHPRTAQVEAAVGKAGAKPAKVAIPGTDLRLVVSVRAVEAGGLEAGSERFVPPGTRAVSLFLVNHRAPKLEPRRDEAFVFQPELWLHCEPGFVPRPNLRGLTDDDWDERVADLQYRDVCEYAVGHGISTRAAVTPGGDCHEVRTAWLPTAEVEKVVPTDIPGVVLSMEELASVASAADLRAKVGGLVDEYRAWITGQRAASISNPRRAEVAKLLLDEADLAAGRIAAGIDCLDAPDVLEAFRLANRAMATAARQRLAHGGAVKPQDVAAPRWRPFQLAFLLMNLRGIAQPGHDDRELVDLLFFPTGGGKTEAYLGLSAFTLVLRRLRNPGLGSAGVSVLMRYTLRLLTLDQLSRAATLVCALELERQKDPGRLGPWPFEIGLWVGKAATPNRMGARGDGSDDTATARTLRHQTDTRKPSPIPLENCPWCGEKFKPTSFVLSPNATRPLDLRVTCSNYRGCVFVRDRALPLVTVDEPIYRRLPCFLIATVDKYASLPWVGQVGALFGKVERQDGDGFYGPADPGKGTRLEKPLLPPDLIIQDELHLISGPLGSMAGLYEAVIEALCLREEGGHTIRPKIVASTATVRRADQQVRALFCRSRVDVFPPPGPDRRHSFFAKTVPNSEKNARLYLGVAAQGRSPKVMLLRTYLALLAGAQRLYEQAGGKRNKGNPADPYMTLVGYFNALRELGGSRRIVEDEVRSRLHVYGQRTRVGEDKGLFAARSIQYDPVELTSREPTSRVAEAKRRLALARHEDGPVDVALATNMISVGLDITRLGLMVVLGQPKTTAEYIQATSRVGRDDERPGLVVTLLNVHRPRDRSHYERFEAYHASFYRAVEVTSVTPFAPRAIDRGLAAVVVGYARQAVASLTGAQQAISVEGLRPQLGFVADALARRAEEHAQLSASEAEALRRKVKERVTNLLDEWVNVARAKRDARTTLQYQKYESTGPHLLFDPLDAELARLPSGPRKFKAHRSLRDVEASAPLFVKTPEGIMAPEEAE